MRLHLRIHNGRKIMENIGGIRIKTAVNEPRIPEEISNECCGDLLSL